MPAAKYTSDQIMAWMSLGMNDTNIHEEFGVSKERLKKIRLLYYQTDKSYISDGASDEKKEVRKSKSPSMIEVLESIVKDGQVSSIPDYQQIAVDLIGKDKNRRYATKIIKDFLTMVMNRYRLEVK